MVFTAPQWVSKLPFDPPDSIPICDFVFDEKYGRQSLNKALDPFLCGITTKSYSAVEVRDRVELLARGLAKETGWNPNKGSEWDKVVGIFAVNTVSTS